MILVADDLDRGGRSRRDAVLGGVRGAAQPARARLVGVGDRPSPGQGPQDRAPLPGRPGRPARCPQAGRPAAGSLRHVRRGPAGGQPAPGRDGAGPGAWRAGLCRLLPDAGPASGRRPPRLWGLPWSGTGRVGGDAPPARRGPGRLVAVFLDPGRVDRRGRGAAVRDPAVRSAAAVRLLLRTPKLGAPGRWARGRVQLLRRGTDRGAL